MRTNFDLLAETVMKEMAFGLGNNTPVTIQEFVDKVIDFNNQRGGTMPISFTSVTNPQYRKTGCPFKRIWKVGQTNGMIGTDYEKNVNAQREREGKTADFVKQQFSNVKEWLSDSVGITTTGLRVIAYRPINTSPANWVVEDALGHKRQVPESEIKPFLSGSRSSNQGVDKEVQYRLYGTDKIVAATFMKQEYIIEDIDPVREAVFEIVKDSLKS